MGNPVQAPVAAAVVETQRLQAHDRGHHLDRGQCRWCGLMLVYAAHDACDGNRVIAAKRRADDEYFRWARGGL